MSLFKRAKPDPITAAAVAEARAAEMRADLERVRLTAEIDRERAAADREAGRVAELAAEEDRRRQQVAREADRVKRQKARKAFLAKVGPMLPLLLINGGAAYAQAAYAYAEIAPDKWDAPSKLAFALAFSAALESIAVYVQWHAHDALLLKSYATAARLRRSSWVIAAVVAGINYTHFAGKAMSPTPAAIAFGMLSLLSPWLWGLHTRRAQHVQLLAEDSTLIDDGGAEFSPDRRRAFPIRSWMAKRWSIDHGVRDPREAWRGYNTERQARIAARVAARPVKVAKKAAPSVPIVDLEVPSPTVAQAPTVDRPAPVKRSTPKTLTAADKVAKVAARMPDATNAALARKAGVSESTVKRHRPKLPTVADAAANVGVDPAVIADAYAAAGFNNDGTPTGSPSAPDAAETPSVETVNGIVPNLVQVTR